MAHGRPLPLDPEELKKLALTIKEMNLKYVVITSVDRDDLRDGGAQHFADCIKEIREHSPQTCIEILTPDFRGRMEQALEVFRETPPDVFNPQPGNRPRMYRVARPGADYQVVPGALAPHQGDAHVPTKSGLMMGLGETNEEEIVQVLKDLRARRQHADLGQYLQLSRHHLPVKRYAPPAEFDELKDVAMDLGFPRRLRPFHSVRPTTRTCRPRAKRLNNSTRKRGQASPPRHRQKRAPLGALLLNIPDSAIPASPWLTLGSGVKVATPFPE